MRGLVLMWTVRPARRREGEEAARWAIRGALCGGSGEGVTWWSETPSAGFEAVHSQHSVKGDPARLKKMSKGLLAIDTFGHRTVPCLPGSSLEFLFLCTQRYVVENSLKI